MNSLFSDAFIRCELISAAAITGSDDGVLGMHCLGKKPVAALNRLPVQHISAPILNTDNSTLYERWLTDSPCRSGQFENIVFRSTDTLLFGVIEIDESTCAPSHGVSSNRVSSTPVSSNTESGLREAAEKAYRQIFSLLDAEGFEYLWRTWNYIPNIHAEEGGLERYRQFNVGRHNAFVSCGRAVDHSPAASALGTRTGFFSIAFIAGRSKPTRIENPRQVSAFDYPEQYGPRSPTFTRAVTVANNTHEALFISGTASIVGHETLHLDDVSAQTQETIANLAALLQQATTEPRNKKIQAPPFTLQNLSYRIYIRHAEDLSKVRAVLNDLIGNPINATYVQADICREDLLIEIEAFAVRSLSAHAV